MPSTLLISSRRASTTSSTLACGTGARFLNIGMILADVHLTFRSPIHFGQPVRVGVRVSRLGNKSLNMEYHLEDASTGRELAHGSTVSVAYDYQDGKTIPLPETWRTRNHCI